MRRLEERNANENKTNIVWKFPFPLLPLYETLRTNIQYKSQVTCSLICQQNFARLSVHVHWEQRFEYFKALFSAEKKFA